MLEGLTDGVSTHVFYESPHRVLDTLADVGKVFGAGQGVVLARELTKLHEEFLRGPVSEVLATLSARAQVRGEFVLLFQISAAGTGEHLQGGIAEAVRALQAEEGLPEMDALKRVARERGMGKSAAYREMQRELARRRPR